MEKKKERKNKFFIKTGQDYYKGVTVVFLFAIPNMVNLLLWMISFIVLTIL